MSAPAIVERAAALGVSLWVEGERIGIEGPAYGVATVKPELAACKPEVLAYLLELRQGVKSSAAGDPPAGKAANDAQAGRDDCAGALVDAESGAPFLPWGPYLSPADVQRLRDELVDMADALAQAEAWTVERRADTMERAANGPLSDLLPNAEHFNARVIEHRAEAEARALLAVPGWRLDRAKR